MRPQLICQLATTSCAVCSSHRLTTSSQAHADVNNTELHLWLWTITDEITGKRRQTQYRMTEETARERFGDDALKVEGSLEVRTPNQGTNFLGSRIAATGDNDRTDSLTGQQIEAQTAAFFDLPTIAGSNSVGSARGYANVASEFLEVVELLAQHSGVPLRPRAYLAAQTLECILKAYIVHVDASKLGKPLRTHDLIALWEMAVKASDAATRKLTIPADPPGWCTALARLHDVPYVNRYPIDEAFMVLMPEDAQLAGALLTEVTDGLG
jgi:hypothetical protein